MHTLRVISFLTFLTFLAFHFNKLEKEKQVKLTARKKKKRNEIIEIRVGVNTIENRKTIQKISKAKS